MASYTKQIVDALHSILCDGTPGPGPKGKTTGDDPWTGAILSALAKCRQQNGFVDYKHHCAKALTHKSLLFDQLWVEYNNEGNIVDFPLIAESELNGDKKWRIGEQREDFEKLLAANASYRLFICQLDPANHLKEVMGDVENDLLDKLTALLETYRRAHMGDVFLIVIMQYRRAVRYLKYRELVCGHSGWVHRDDIRNCSQQALTNQSSTKTH
ncbi:MAG: hypothetical protein IPJ10_11185 [Flavobacteriales bacterium]|jgi:hypothetical protein|nr:hypothetical protein [Flavobacteriales bacterium]